MSLFRQSAALVLTTKLTATEKEVHKNHKHSKLTVTLTQTKLTELKQEMTNCTCGCTVHSCGTQYSAEQF